MTDEEVAKQFVERMGALTRDEVDAEQEWAQAVLTFQKATLTFGRRLADFAKRKGIRLDLPLREQMAEMPGGTWRVARFDHAAEVVQILDEIQRDPVGMLG